MNGEKREPTEGELVIKGIKYSIIGAVVLVLAMIGSCQTTNYQIRKMAEAGIHPRVAECAISGSCSLSSLEIIQLQGEMEKGDD